LLLAVDPGGTTGWSLWAISDDGHPELISSGQVLTWHGLDGIISEDVAIVVMEAFRLFPQRAKEQIGSDFPAVQVIGVVRYLCEKRGIEVVLKPAGDKEFFDDKKLEIAGFMPYERGERHHNRHALDSVRHMLHYLHFACKVHITYA
jgi:hypothetical protein